VLDCLPHRGEEHEPCDHPRGQGQQDLDDPVPQLADVIHERNAALGVLLPLRAHEPLTDDPGARDSAGEFRHDLLPASSSATGV
jgi:hypothetical protein